MYSNLKKKKEYQTLVWNLKPACFSQMQFPKYLLNIFYLQGVLETLKWTIHDLCSHIAK